MSKLYKLYLRTLFAHCTDFPSKGTLSELVTHSMARIDRGKTPLHLPTRTEFYAELKRLTVAAPAVPPIKLLPCNPQNKIGLIKVLREIAHPFPTRPPSTISPKPRQPASPAVGVPAVRPMPAKPLADLPDVSDDATALSHADVAALVAARLSEGEAPQHDAPQLEGAFQRAKDGTGVGQAVPSPAPVAAPSAAAIAAVPAAPAAVSVAPCEAPQRRKGLL